MCDDLLGWVCFGSVTVVFFMQFTCALYCWHALAQKSPRVLWCVDWADILFRLEREFGIRFCPNDFGHLGTQQLLDMTAGDLFLIVRRKVWDTGRPVSADSWQRLTEALSEALNIEPSSIRCESRLCADLGMA